MNQEFWKLQELGLKYHGVQVVAPARCLSAAHSIDLVKIYKFQHAQGAEGWQRALSRHRRMEGPLKAHVVSRIRLQDYDVMKPWWLGSVEGRSVSQSSVLLAQGQCTGMMMVVNNQ